MKEVFRGTPRKRGWGGAEGFELYFLLENRPEENERKYRTDSKNRQNTDGFLMVTKFAWTTWIRLKIQNFITEISAETISNNHLLIFKENKNIIAFATFLNIFFLWKKLHKRLKYRACDLKTPGIVKMVCKRPLSLTALRVKLSAYRSHEENSWKYIVIYKFRDIRENII